MKLSKEKFMNERHSHPAQETVLPAISVVIPAHNEEQFLPATLDALALQDYPNFEVIVVANGCTDRTAEVVQGKCDHFVDLTERGLGPARNTGAAKARGDLLVFLDADTILDPTALRTIAQQFTPKFSMGTLRGLPDSRKARYKIIYFAKNLIHRTHLHHGSSGVILCWKDHFNTVGGFNNELYLRENSDLMKKLRRFGKYRYIGQTPALTSMRRYEKAGTWEMVWLWLRVWYLSNFSDIRNQTYEGMSHGAPRLSKLHAFIARRVEKRRKALRTRNAPVGY